MIVRIVGNISFCPGWWNRFGFPAERKSRGPTWRNRFGPAARYCSPVRGLTARRRRSDEQPETLLRPVNYSGLPPSSPLRGGNFKSVTLRTRRATTSRRSVVRTQRTGVGARIELVFSSDDSQTIPVRIIRRIENDFLVFSNSIRSVNILTRPCRFSAIRPGTRHRVGHGLRVGLRHIEVARTVLRVHLYIYGHCRLRAGRRRPCLGRTDNVYASLTVVDRRETVTYTSQRTHARTS